MRVIHLKTGHFAFHPVSGPVHFCEEGKIESLPDYQAEMLIGQGWSKADKINAQSFENIQVDPYPWEKKDFNPLSRDAKQILADFAQSRLNFVIDKRKSVRNLIAELKKIIKYG